MPPNLSRRAALVGGLAALVLLDVAPALAQDDRDIGLYAPAPPPGSAFVRLLNGAPAGGPVAGKIGARAIPAVAVGEASAYVPVPQGEVTVQAGGSQRVKVEAGRFYTVAFGLGGAAPLKVMDDPTLASRAKAGLVLYNLTSTAGLELATADGAVVVLSGVAPWTLASREVNALTVGFVVRGPGGALATVPTVTLARGAVYGVVVREGAKGATWIEARTSTTDK